MQFAARKSAGQSVQQLCARDIRANANVSYFRSAALQPLRESGQRPPGTKVTTACYAVFWSRNDIMATQQLWTASYMNGKMRPPRVDFWGLWPRQLLAGLAILLAAAVLSLILFPAGHGSFVSTHGPATAFRSRRLLLSVCLWLATLLEILAGDRIITLSWLRSSTTGQRTPLRKLPQVSPLSAVLLC